MNARRRPHPSAMPAGLVLLLSPLGCGVLLVIGYELFKVLAR